MERRRVKAMILAAGVGKRMRPLTDQTPKPLLRAGGVPLMEYHIRALADAGITELVINVSHLAQQIVEYCGDGSRWGVSIVYSHEDEPLETAGGIHRALPLLRDQQLRDPLLGEQPFLVANGDVWCSYPFERLLHGGLQSGETARLVMVDNPPQHTQGDYCLADAGWIRRRPPNQVGFTYAGIGLYSPEFFAGMRPGKLALRPLLDAAIDSGTLGGEYFEGPWQDIGTPERLQALDRQLRAN
jgi:MurNAc alpha-1-phosphate uridylyltransferase